MCSKYDRRERVDHRQANAALAEIARRRLERQASQHSTAAASNTLLHSGRGSESAGQSRAFAQPAAASQLARGSGARASSGAGPAVVDLTHSPASAGSSAASATAVLARGQNGAAASCLEDDLSDDSGSSAGRKGWPSGQQRGHRQLNRLRRAGGGGPTAGSGGSQRPPTGWQPDDVAGGVDSLLASFGTLQVCRVPPPKDAHRHCRTPAEVFVDLSNVSASFSRKSVLWQHTASCSGTGVSKDAIRDDRYTAAG